MDRTPHEPLVSKGGATIYHECESGAYSRRLEAALSNSCAQPSRKQPSQGTTNKRSLLTHTWHGGVSPYTHLARRKQPRKRNHDDQATNLSATALETPPRNEHAAVVLIELCRPNIRKPATHKPGTSEPQNNEGEPQTRESANTSLRMKGCSPLLFNVKQPSMKRTEATIPPPCKFDQSQAKSKP